MKKILSVFLILLILSGSIWPVQALGILRPQLNLIGLYPSPVIKEILLPSDGRSEKSEYFSKNIFNDESYRIPDLNTSFVPQGLCEVTIGQTIVNKDKFDEKEYHLITAYDNNEKQNSRIYIMNVGGSREKNVSIKNSIGKHVGGITEYKGKIWVVSTKVIYVIEKKDLFDGDSIVTPDTIETLPINNVDLKGNYSFSTTSNDGQYLWIGEFKEKGVAYANAFSYDDKTKELKHYATMQIPNRAQGMCFDNNNNVYISTTPINLSSFIDKYEYKIESPKQHTVYKQYKQYKYKIFTLQYKEMISAPMGIEGIFSNENGDIWAIFESGSKVYWWMGLLGGVERRVVLIDM